MRLLSEVFDDGTDGPFDEWWPRISRRCRIRSGAVFPGHRRQGPAGGGGIVLDTAFVKDLAVHPEARGKGIGEALMWQAFAAFRERGAAHVDLKTNTVENAAAVRLYERLGMTQVAWEG